MKVVQINAVCGKGSTGNIVLNISKLLTLNDIENYVLYSSGESNYPLSIKYANDFNIKYNALRSRIFGNWGLNGVTITKRLISYLDKIEPNIVHIHNIHAHNVHLELLFKYLAEKKIKVFWTFHDCWAFTGYCMHFDMFGCDKWMDSCDKCVCYKDFSWFSDKSKKLQQTKKELLSKLDLTIITPSIWLSNLVKKSFLKEFSIKVINNGIDLSIFMPQESDFRKKYNLENKKVVLGVSFVWDVKKGLDVFLELSKRLNSDYQIVLVGTNEKIDKLLPSNILSIHKTQDIVQLAQIYSACDVFVNPTREDTLPTVDMEALACGLPVVTFNTGGSVEIVDNTCGYIVEKNDVDLLEKAVIRVCEEKPFLKENCVERAKHFNKTEKFIEYIDLFKGNLL